MKGYKLEDRVYKKYKNTISIYPKIGVPYKFFPAKVREWLENGGLEKIEEEMPLTYELIKEMDRETDLPSEFGLTTRFTRQVEKKMKEKGYLNQDEILYPAEVHSIFTFSLNPFFPHSKRVNCLIEAAVEVLEEKIKENPEKEYLRHIFNIFKFWKDVNERIKGEV